MDWTLGIKLFAALFAIMSPITNVPIFLTTTSGFEPAARQKAAHAAIATVVIGSIVCAVAGQPLLDLFGIDVNHFRLAGGLIVLLIGLSMLGGEDHSSHAGTPAEQKSFAEATSLGVYPLGIPIMLGPGTIATILVFGQQASEQNSIVVFAVALVAYLVFFSAFLLAAPFVGKYLSPMTMSIARRIMGMILAAIAMEMIAGSLGKLFPAWVG